MSEPCDVNDWCVRPPNHRGRCRDVHEINCDHMHIGRDRENIWFCANCGEHFVPLSRLEGCEKERDSLLTLAPFPGCMAPDGAEPCAHYAAALDDLRASQAISEQRRAEMQAAYTVADDLRSRLDACEKALRRSVTAIDDWLNTFAYDLCDEKRVAEAHERIHREGGTLHYIAVVQQDNRAALGVRQPTWGETVVETGRIKP